MPQTLKLNSKSVKFPPIPSIAPLSWEPTSLPSVEAQNRLSLPKSFPWGQPPCCGKTRKRRYYRHAQVQLPRRQPKVADPFQHGGQHFPGHQHFSKLEHKSPGVAYQPPSGLDQPGLNTGQGPVPHTLRQGQPSHEVAQVVSQDKHPQPHRIGHELVAGQPGPVQGVLALFNPLLRRVPAIGEANYTFGWEA